MKTIHPSAVVDADSIGERVSVAEFAVIRPGVLLGDDVRVHPHVVIESGVEIGPGTELLPGTYAGRRPRAVGAIARKPHFEERLTIGGGCSIGTHAVLYCGSEIGPDTLIGDEAMVREMVRVGRGCVVGRSVAVDVDVEIGDDTVIMFGTSVVGKARIGSGVFVATGVNMTNDNVLGRDGWEEGEIAGPTIEDGARIGSNATLLPGVRIGCDAIVGAGAVVTRDVEPGQTVVGNPGRPLEPRPDGG